VRDREREGGRGKRCEIERRKEREEVLDSEREGV
jgi:hypothetical protein